jgi:cytoskeletal protein CcmA (bactofilin family)
MWKFWQVESPVVSPTSEPTRPAPAPVRVAASVYQSNIAKGITVIGDITGSESLFIDGIVEGSIDLPENRVTVGPNGQVNATIVARDVVVLGKVCGSVAVSNLLDIRAQGSLTGDVSAARLSLEDGGFFQGVVDIHETEAKLGPTLAPHDVDVPASKPVRVVQPEPARIRMQPLAQSA